MRFMVISRAIEPSPVGFADQLELLEATQERLVNRTHPRIQDVFSFAGERAFAFIVEADRARDLNYSVFALPAEPLMSFEVHVLAEPDPRLAQQTG